VQDVEGRQPHRGHGRTVLPITPTTAASESDLSPPGADQLRAALKHSASALKADGIPFALAGGYALWVHGAPESVHDVDLVVTEDQVEAAATSLAAAGFQIERPPEDWLFKAYRDGAMVDVLHRVNSRPVGPEMIGTAEQRDVLGLHIPVLPPIEVITGKLLAMSERYCDFGQMLPAVRAVREQLDWAQLAETTASNPYAEAFLVLAERLGIAPEGVLDSVRR
jgi:hypothetical protein